MPAEKSFLATRHPSMPPGMSCLAAGRAPVYSLSVEREQAWQTVRGFLVREFGRLLDVRDVRRLRRVAGEGWSVTVVLTSPAGDLHVADVVLDEAGVMTPLLDASSVIAAVNRAQTISMMPPPPDDAMADMGDFGAAEDDGAGLENLEMADDPVEVRVASALMRGDKTALREARDLLPRLLTDHEKRGPTLLTMAEVDGGEASVSRRSPRAIWKPPRANSETAST